MELEFLFVLKRVIRELENSEDEELLFQTLIKYLKSLWFSTPPPKEGKHISTKLVRKRLVDSMTPILKAAGFEAFVHGRAYRYHEKWVDVVEIQFIRTYTTTSHSPSLHIGRYFTFVPEDAISGPVKKKHNRIVPSESECHFRKMVYKTLKQRETKIPNIWFIGTDGKYLEECINEVTHITETQIIPWFNWLDDLDVVMQLLRFGEADMEGKDKNPIKRGTWNFTNYFSGHVIAGLLACELKQWDLAIELLTPVLESGGLMSRPNGPFILKLPEVSMTQLQTVYDNAKRDSINPTRSD
ncbi:MAG: DUF4304 domain-containing protein [Undibacterium sp.]|nr:DUF4304 domain-containing protein [Undibacterium sp.]